jgi:Nucleotidyltransferase domain
VIPEPAATVIGRFVATLDRALPGVIGGFYVVGSIALGAFRPGRSDIDFVATLPRPLSPAEIGTLRAVHRRSCAEGFARMVTTPPRSWPLVCNGVFVRGEDLARPRTATAMASQVAGHFGVGTVRPEPGHLVDARPRRHRGAGAGPGTPGYSPRRRRVAGVDRGQPGRLLAALGGSPDRRPARQLAGAAAAVPRAPAGGLGRVRRGPDARHDRHRHGDRQGAGRRVRARRVRRGLAPGDPGALAYWRGLPPVPNRSSRTVRAETAAFVSHVVGLVGAR